MFGFGLVSSLFDFVTFAFLLYVAQGEATAFRPAGSWNRCCPNWLHPAPQGARRPPG